jgi:hypothetical protein
LSSLSHHFRLFDVPAEGILEGGTSIAGGLSTGGFILNRAGEFTDWRREGWDDCIHKTVEQNRFYLNTDNSHENGGLILHSSYTCSKGPLCWFVWDMARKEFEFLRVESLAFSPQLPAQDCAASLESQLPVWINEFRAANEGNTTRNVSLMLTWICAWPELVTDAVFDFQHDNLCLTGSLGSLSSPERQGIALPDLHSEGIYQQGIEPWVVEKDQEEILNDFWQDGELDPRTPGQPRQGAAAWVRFSLAPGEMKKVPFAVVWHFPFIESGPRQGEAREYTRQLTRRRPDNAIVWLAEQPFQNYRTEMRNYEHWMRAFNVK